MTGEMCKADVTREAFPLHFAVKEALKRRGVSVKPFDVYQGPYIFVPGMGRFFLTGDYGDFWWSESTRLCSEPFWGWDADGAEAAVEAFRDLLRAIRKTKKECSSKRKVTP